MQTQSFSTRHPFWADLFKRIITIVVSWNLIIGLAMATFFGGIFMLIAMAASVSTTSMPDQPTYDHIYGNNTMGDRRLLSVKIDGTVVGDETDAGIFSDGYTSGYAVKKRLIQAASDDTIKGVVLEINSPGGTIYGAHAIADGVAFYREKTHRPVYAHIQGLGASGSYWAAASADKVVADYGSEIGSIGVIMGPFQYYNKPMAEDGGLLAGGIVTQNGIESTTITAGRSKDIGNPYRKLTDAEVAQLQKSINNEYDGFVQYVSMRRDIPAETIRNQIGAMIYDNKTALGYKLIDETSSREDVYHELADKASLGSDFEVVREQTGSSFLRAMMGAVTHSQQQKVAFDACTLTRSALAYHGDVSALCLQKQ